MKPEDLSYFINPEKVIILSGFLYAIVDRVKEMFEIKGRNVQKLAFVIGILVAFWDAFLRGDTFPPVTPKLIGNTLMLGVLLSGLGVGFHSLGQRKPGDSMIEAGDQGQSALVALERQREEKRRQELQDQEMVAGPDNLHVFSHEPVGDSDHPARSHPRTGVPIDAATRGEAIVTHMSVPNHNETRGRS